MPIFKFNRIVHESSMFSHFNPTGIKGHHLEQIILTLDKFEAFRLAGQQGLSHALAADEMEISRSTFSRLIEKDRKKITDSIILGRTLTIGGGTVHFRSNIIQNRYYGHMLITNFKKIAENVSNIIQNKLNLAGNFGHGKCCI